MKIVIAGASGLVGRALGAQLRADGDDVLRLERGGVAARDAIAWQPPQRLLDPAALEGVDAVVNLAGENIGAGRWTAERRQRIRSSRIHATATLVEAMAAMHRPPRVLVNASAVGAYGDCGDEIVTESSPFGRGLLAEVCAEWESEAQRAAKFGTRVVCLRLGVVLAKEGGALARLRPLFRSGLGGRLGSGRQWMSWVHLDDVVGVTQCALRDERFGGVLNVVAPAPVTNVDFTRALARTVHRPAVLPAPAWALRLALGEMADEALLASTRAVPTRLLELGFAFAFPELGPALQDVV
ncbi:TIGR01777 family oxidoreductase [Opitutus sp. ER46]|uniref:TIGR01777 family oxidoreductase n=1 Tax=Opitutus sp. ER46 TaxID=2161864 RepID=UPI000D3184F9|nr:TIGR01777 family oxidoreductase [Opitutus sp. ER46]PTX99008.1 TIGR01777 family protein [Opitutus sp. ER46]